MKRSLLIPLLLILLLGTLVGGVFVWQHAALFMLIRWPSGVPGHNYLYYALKQSDGFVLARAPKGADGQPLAQPQTLQHFSDGFGLFPSDAISSMQLSPDGKYLAIDGIHGDGEQVWMYDTQNMKMSVLPANVSGNFLHWIPGGDGHAFLYRPMFPFGSGAPLDNGTWNPGLWMVDASTGSQHNIDIGETSANLIDAAPSPDGTHIVYSTTAGLGMGSTTFVMNRDGSNRAQLFSLKDTQQSIAGHFTWSPDGSRIAYERLADSATPFLVAGLWVMDTQFQYPQAGQERPLTPAASQRGKYTHPTLMSQVEMHQGGLQQRVADADGGHGFTPVWSPDSQKLAFVARTNRGDPHADTDEQALRSAVCVVDLATSQVQQIGTEEQTHLPLNINPVWTAHGTRVTFTALNPINRDLGTTQRYWATTLATSTDPSARQQANIVPLSPGIPHVIAAG